MVEVEPSSAPRSNGYSPAAVGVPEICPVTGELHFFDYNWFAPHMTYHCANAAGELVRSVPLEVGGATMMHDFAITEHHVLIMDLPVVFDLQSMIATLGIDRIMGYSPGVTRLTITSMLPRADGKSTAQTFVEVEVYSRP